MARPRVLSREKIASAALRLIDEEGLDALSVERIASELNVRGPSLYHHFPDKAAILTQVAELVLREVQPTYPPTTLYALTTRARRLAKLARALGEAVAHRHLSPQPADDNRRRKSA